MVIPIDIRTHAKTELLDISADVQRAVAESGVVSGVCFLFVPHTTAALTFNENWDRDVRHDMLLTINEMVPQDLRYRHSEGNSPAHIKSSMFGVNLFVFVERGQIQLGRWQGVYFAEFDGPRHRTVWVTVMARA